MGGNSKPFSLTRHAAGRHKKSSSNNKANNRSHNNKNKFFAAGIGRGGTRSASHTFSSKALLPRHPAEKENSTSNNSHMSSVCSVSTATTASTIGTAASAASSTVHSSSMSRASRLSPKSVERVTTPYEIGYCVEDEEPLFDAFQEALLEPNHKAGLCRLYQAIQHTKLLYSESWLDTNIVGDTAFPPNVISPEIIVVCLQPRRFPRADVPVLKGLIKKLGMEAMVKKLVVEKLVGHKKYPKTAREASSLLYNMNKVSEAKRREILKTILFLARVYCTVNFFDERNTNNNGSNSNNQLSTSMEQRCGPNLMGKIEKGLQVLEENTSDTTPRRRGRPKKNDSAEGLQVLEEDTFVTTPRRRGRPKKNDKANFNIEKENNSQNKTKGSLLSDGGNKKRGTKEAKAVVARDTKKRRVSLDNSATALAAFAQADDNNNMEEEGQEKDVDASDEDDDAAEAGFPDLRDSSLKKRWLKAEKMILRGLKEAHPAEREIMVLAGLAEYRSLQKDYEAKDEIKNRALIFKFFGGGGKASLANNDFVDNKDGGGAPLLKGTFVDSKDGGKGTLKDDFADDQDESVLLDDDEQEEEEVEFQRNRAGIRKYGRVIEEEEEEDGGDSTDDDADEEPDTPTPIKPANHSKRSVGLGQKSTSPSSVQVVESLKENDTVDGENNDPTEKIVEIVKTGVFCRVKYLASEKRLDKIAKFVAGKLLLPKWVDEPVKLAQWDKTCREGITRAFRSLRMTAQAAIKCAVHSKSIFHDGVTLLDFRVLLGFVLTLCPSRRTRIYG